MITLLLVIYFSINSFFTGRSYQDDLQYDTRGWIVFCMMIFGFLFALPVLLIYFLQERWFSFVGLAEQYQVKFFFLYFFTGQTYNVDTGKLYDLNMQVKYYRTTKSLKDRVYRKVIRMLNKRNNYTFIEKEPEF